MKIEIEKVIVELIQKSLNLPNNYGYDKANACGKLGITIQGATTLFLTNMKRVIKLNEEKNKKEKQLFN